jgi:hypothetical protein
MTSINAAMIAFAIALTGCADQVAARYHPASQFPPTADVKEAVHVCSVTVNNEFLPENMAMGAALGPIRHLVTDTDQRMAQARQDCMANHGWARNPE